MIKKFKESIKESVYEGLDEITKVVYGRKTADTISTHYNLTDEIKQIKYTSPHEVCVSIELKQYSNPYLGTVNDKIKAFIKSSEFKDYFINSILAETNFFKLSYTPVPSLPSLTDDVITIYTDPSPIYAIDKDRNITMTSDIRVIENIKVEDRCIEAYVTNYTITYTLNNMYIAENIDNGLMTTK